MAGSPVGPIRCPAVVVTLRPKASICRDCKQISCHQQQLYTRRKPASQLTVKPVPKRPSCSAISDRPEGDSSRRCFSMSPTRGGISLRLKQNPYGGGLCKCEGRRRATLWTGIGGYSFRKLVGSQKVEEERQKEDYGRSSRAVPTAFPNGNFTAGKSGKSGVSNITTGDELLLCHIIHVN